MRLDEFNFELPSNLIADKLTLPRDNCKLCIVKNNILQDMYFYEIKKFFNKGDILILNNSKVLRSFIEIKSNNFHKNNISINLHTQVDNNLWLAFCKNSKKVAIGDKFKFDSHILKVIKKNPMGEILLQFELDKISIENFLDKYAKMPIPDYIIKARKKNKTTIKNENNQNISQEIDTNQVNDEAYLELNIDKQESDIDKIDNETYQTVYNEVAGSIAAPTAGLHFTLDLLDELKNQGVIICYVTLHVGIGTYKPIKVENINDHIMHEESVYVSCETINTILDAKAKNNKIFAVGTTSLRSIESSFAINREYINFYYQKNYGKEYFSLNNPISSQDIKNDIQFSSDNVKSSQDTKINTNNNIKILEHFKTSIYIKQGYQFLCIDALITNFHLPKSSLLVLVSAFIGHEKMKKLYNHAIKKEYKFYSYGDASLLFRI